MTLNKLNISVHLLVALTFLLFSNASNSQAETTTDQTAVEQTSADPATENQAPRSLEEEYQRELDKWMLQAYEGDRDAQFKVGVLFTNDQFQSADLEQSAYWYKQAARQGHALAQYNLGHLFLTGNGVKRSESEAMKWWLKAAEQDHPLAQFNIGRAYYLGIGLQEDHSQSRYWFERAAKNNEPKSIDILQQLNWSKPGEYEVAANNQTTARPTTSNDTESGDTESDSDTPLPSNASSAKASPAIPNNGASTENDDGEQIVTSTTPTQSSTESQKTITAQQSSNQVKTTNTASNQVAGESQSTPVLTPKPTAKATNPIAVYTDPSKRSVLITILNDRNQLTIVESSPEWTEVRNSNGFPVWVHQDYIVVSDDIGSIQGNAVNARSVPLITNGTIVGQLFDNETLAVVDKKNAWYRVVSPNRFSAWVKTEEFSRTKNGTQAIASRSQPRSIPLSNNAPINDNDWLFSQPANGYTLQLASFDDRNKVAEFTSRKKFINNPKLHSFTSRSKDILWTYFLYGAYSSSEAAKQARIEINQKLAWVRSFGKLQQNRCLSWKKQIPAPKELNKYCS